MTTPVTEYAGQPDPTAGADGVFVVALAEGASTRVPAFRDADGSIVCRLPGEPAAWDSVTSADGRPLHAVRRHEVTAPYLRADEVGSLLRTEGGEPYLWMADTHWFALTDRISASDWSDLLDRRLRQGFNTVQVVAGLLPEAELGSAPTLLAGRPAWSAVDGTMQLDAGYWSAADDRVLDAARRGVVVAMVGAWSYYLRDLGEAALQRHWHEVVARWGAFPTVWCVAGEMGLMHYEELSRPDATDVAREIQREWASIARHLRQIDPWERPVTAHPCPAFGDLGSLDVIDPELVDLVWLQTGHADVNSVPSSLAALARSRAATRMPVLNSEVCYEGIAGGSTAMLQRFLFWSHLLGGAAGHTYGAQGLWAFHDGMDSPGAVWGDVPWRAAADLAGAEQLGRAADLLRELAWAGAVPVQDRVTPAADIERPFLLWAAEVGDALVVYAPAASLRPPGIGISTELVNVRLAGFGELDAVRLRVVDPRSGRTVRDEPVPVREGNVELGATSLATSLPTLEDWVLVLG